MTYDTPERPGDEASVEAPNEQMSQKEANVLRQRDLSYVQTKKRLEETLENLRIHQEELRVQNENLWKIQAELEDSHEKYLDLFESAPIGYFILDKSGQVEEVNLTGCNMLRRDRAQLVQTNLDSYIQLESRDSFNKHLSQIFLGSRHASVEVAFLEKSEQAFFGFLESVPIRNANNQITRCRTAVINITERKRLESQVQYAQKLECLGVLAGGIAHDVNNLLAVISSHTGLALRDVSQGSRQHDRLKTIEKSALRGGELAHQLLAYAGRSKATMQSLDLSELIRDMSHLIQIAISQKGVLQYDLAEDLPRIRADPSQMRQILVNLTTNASEALEGKHGVVRVSTAKILVTQDVLKRCVLAGDGDMVGEEAVCLEVADSGCGIHQNDLPKIFDPFFTTKFTGRGLGLAALLGIVRAHGGAIAVSSEMGQGTLFRMVFPVTSDRNNERATASPVPVQRVVIDNRGALVLIIDDEEEICTAAQLILEEAGYNVLVASDGKEGIQLFQEYADEIKGVLLDLTMPHLNGEEVFREIRRIRGDVPIVVSSGHSDEEARDRLKEQEICFIQKPYLINELPEKLQKLLNNT